MEPEDELNTLCPNIINMKSLQFHRKTQLQTSIEKHIPSPEAEQLGTVFISLQLSH